MATTTDDLAKAPQLAILDALRDLLDHAIAILVVQHPESADTHGLVGLPPEVWVADHLAVACATSSASSSATARPPQKTPATALASPSPRCPCRITFADGHHQVVCEPISQPARQHREARRQHLLRDLHGRVRDEFLNETWFIDIDEVVEKANDWRTEFNELRPHLASLLDPRGVRGVIHIGGTLRLAGTKEGGVSSSVNLDPGLLPNMRESSMPVVQFWEAGQRRPIPTREVREAPGT
jgi:hypothetical protein